MNDPNEIRAELERLGVDPVDAQAAAEGRCKITFQRPKSSKRTPWGDSIDGYGFGISLNFWDYWAFVARGVEARVDTPFGRAGMESVLRALACLTRSGLCERIGRDELKVVLWDDGEAVHVEGERDSVEAIAGEVRAAIERAAS